eukprot:Hpha_TRINITY_DN16267_c4_g5::TRINITY_DN16267_c4_g5_i4::g.13547::m.13547
MLNSTRNFFVSSRIRRWLRVQPPVRPFVGKHDGPAVWEASGGRYVLDARSLQQPHQLLLLVLNVLEDTGLARRGSTTLLAQLAPQLESHPPSPLLLKKPEELIGDVTLVLPRELEIHVQTGALSKLGAFPGLTDLVYPVPHPHVLIDGLPAGLNRLVLQLHIRHLYNKLNLGVKELLRVVGERIQVLLVTLPRPLPTVLVQGVDLEVKRPQGETCHCEDRGLRGGFDHVAQRLQPHVAFSDQLILVVDEGALGRVRLVPHFIVILAILPVLPGADHVDETFVKLVPRPVQLGTGEGGGNYHSVVTGDAVLDDLW